MPEQVRVGSMADPEDTPGLAHFLEHMLFYSSEKYPVEDEYSKFLVRHAILAIVVAGSKFNIAGLVPNTLVDLLDY